CANFDKIAHRKANRPCHKMKRMYNKGSCRICGTFLIATSVCDVCTEHISWTCGHCDRTDDITHSHEITAYQSTSGI
ncbi:MAG: hypothetical protein WA393_10470, partial [Nitrososphaeraceae archaeon]